MTPQTLSSQFRTLARQAGALGKQITRLANRPETSSLAVLCRSLKVPSRLRAHPLMHITTASPDGLTSLATEDPDCPEMDVAISHPAGNRITVSADPL